MGGMVGAVIAASKQKTNVMGVTAVAAGQGLQASVTVSARAQTGVSTGAGQNAVLRISPIPETGNATSLAYRPSLFITEMHVTTGIGTSEAFNARIAVDEPDNANFWDGEKWVPGVMSVWTGTEWKRGRMRMWDGAQWK
jgi:hypothetical protein